MALFQNKPFLNLSLKGLFSHTVETKNKYNQNNIRNPPNWAGLVYLIFTT